MKTVTGVVSILIVFLCFARAQERKVEVPPFTISIAYWSNSTPYDYRVVTDGSKQYLEMRQSGKQKWMRVEDVTCMHSGDYESESFDYQGICKAPTAK